MAQADGGSGRWATAGKKKAGSGDCLPERGSKGSDVGLGLAEAVDAVARLPLVALAQDFNALEALEDVAFDDEAGDALEAFVL
jgi:hypothetical protein